MLDVERIAEVELGLTDDMMTENGGRGIATVAIQAFGKRISASNHNALPVVLVFAGNNKSGSRAIAAGRHLKNHHVRTMVCVLSLEREDELLENVRRQLNIFRNAGGRVARWEEMQSNIKALDSPPELIIDGLLGMHLSFEDLRMDDQATAFEMVQFANKSKASVLSVDIPSGVDGSTGLSSPPLSSPPTAGLANTLDRRYCTARGHRCILHARKMGGMHGCTQEGASQRNRDGHRCRLEPFSGRYRDLGDGVEEVRDSQTRGRVLRGLGRAA
jgi:NAD(P)H-hydrate repair Nnr-like enzyme with NAD(P)H-hydrate epimerase domain